MLWIGLGFAITLIPVLIVGFIAAKIFKLNYSHNVGMLCGSMANPMALTYANTTVSDDEPSVAYATVYPLSMFVRVISAQLLIAFFA
jgi:AspT/YidE/YbjL antiporter-like protein